ncbi:MAG: flagellar hook-associated protein FlgK [Lachnospiraceae bacterium]|nr:flagellar hook-associated protein FlgK [Candidatus Colinaster scatohippi]
MPLMGSLYIGVSGLQTSQNALNTTAHNISNLDTQGYVRQQVQQGTAVYNTIQYNNKAVSNQQIGLGVVYSRTRQVRDTFLDSTYRKESGRSAFYEVSYDAIGEIESLLDEMNGETFEESIQDLWTSVQELAKDPSSAVTQGLFVERCSEFVARSQSVYEGLREYQSSLNQTVKTHVDRINEIAQEIKTLNDAIRNIEITNIANEGISFEKANDLRDSRNAYLDELSKYGNITYSEDADCTVWVQLEGEDLVRGEIAYKIGLYQSPETGFYTPFWEKNAKFILDTEGKKVYTEEEANKAKVFDLKRVISSDLNTDIGALKSTLLARGDHAADYTDLLIDRYDYEISQSVCMNVMAEFDQLIHGIATTINGILADAAYAARQENPSSHYLMTFDDKLNTYVPIQVFQKIASDGYSSDGAGGYQYNEERPGVYDPATGKVTGYVNESLYTTTNLQINAELLQQPTKLGFVLIDGSVDYGVMEKIKAAFEDEASTLNPNVKKKSSYVDYYGDLVSQIANSGYVYRSLMDSQQATVSAADNAREQIIGVSQDEELTHMIKFQNAYNASSRYINVVDEMLEHIINTLGM